MEKGLISLDEQLNNIVENNLVCYRLNREEIVRLRIKLACCETIYGLAGDNMGMAKKYFKIFEDKIATI